MAESEYLVHVTDDNFESEIEKSERPVLVDFWAPWCGPCIAIGPAIEEIAQAYGETLKVAKVNVDECPQAAGSLGIRSIPTLMVFKGGKVEETIIGLVSKDRIEETIKKVLSL